MSRPLFPPLDLTFLTKWLLGGHHSRRSKQPPESRLAFAWFFLRSERDARLPIAPGAGYQITEWCECDANVEVVLEANAETSPRAYRIMMEQGERFLFIGLCVAPVRSDGKAATGSDFARARWDVAKYQSAARIHHAAEGVNGIRAPFI